MGRRTVQVPLGANRGDAILIDTRKDFIALLVGGVLAIAAATGTGYAESPPCPDLNEEIRNGAELTKYFETEKGGHRYLIYYRLDKDGMESGWIVHRKNCPCGWATTGKKETS